MDGENNEPSYLLTAKCPTLCKHCLHASPHVVPTATAGGRHSSDETLGWEKLSDITQSSRSSRVGTHT